MRRFLLILTILSVRGWSQPPAQQPAQPPIVVKVEMPQAPHRDWIDLLEAFGPLIAAGVAVIVGLVQCYLQWKKQKQDLFENCFAIYKAADNCVSDTINRNCKPDRESYHAFQHATDPARFFFGADVLEVLDWIRDQAGWLATESDVPVDRTSEQTASQRYVSGIMRAAAFSNQWDNRKSVFWPYLQIHYTQRWYARLEEYMERVTEANDQRIADMKQSQKERQAAQPQPAQTGPSPQPPAPGERSSPPAPPPEYVMSEGPQAHPVCCSPVTPDTR